MNRSLILQALELEENTPIYLLRLDMKLWGRGLIFSGEAEKKPFKLSFLDCSDSRWRYYRHNQNSNEAFITSEIVNFRVGRSLGRSPAQILCEHFGIILVYGELFLEWDEKRIPLSEG
jgi:hypothetical protein